MEQNKVKIMIWNSNSIRDFTIKSFFIQQIYENKIDIALIQETMLKENDAFYIKNYRIFRANSKFRRGVAIIISKQLDCDAYKTIEDTEGRYLQIKLKDAKSEITISTAYVEPDLDKDPTILPQNIYESHIFGGDLNKMKTGFKITSNVYHIKNLGNEIEKIQIIKKISDHPMVIFEKTLPFKRIEGTKTINTFNYESIRKNMYEIKKIIISEDINYIPQLIDPKIQKQINNFSFIIDNNDYMEYFENIKRENKEKFTELKKRKQEEIAKLFQCNALGREPYQRLSSLMQYNFDKKIWNENNKAKEEQITEGFKVFFQHENQKIVNIEKMYQSMGALLNLIIESPLSKNMSAPDIPYSRARDKNGFSQRDIMKIIKGQNLQNTAINLRKILEYIYKSEKKELLLHRTSKTFFMKKKENIENFRDLRMLSIMPSIIMVLDKVAISIIKEKCKNKLTKNQHGARENHNVNTAKIELLLQAKAEGLNKALLLDLEKAFDTVKRDKLEEQLKIFCENDEILYNMLKHILIIYQNINYDICGTLIEPSTGIPQGSVFGPTLFLIYINETIKQANTTLQNVAIEVFVDDIIIMSNDISSLQIAYDFFNIKINELGMKLNTKQV